MEPFDGIRQVIDQNIYENQDGDITGEVMNQVLNDVVDAFEEAVTDGNNIRAFKGWWPDLATLKAAITAQPGDSAYVKDASPATTWSIYVYSASATSDNNWANSGSKADTSNAQTFASGEEVNQTYIDNTGLANPKSGALPTAEDVLQLKVKLEGVTASDVKVNAVVGTNVTTGKYVSGETGALTTPSSYASQYGYFTTEIPQGTKSIRFMGGSRPSSSYKTGYTLGYYDADNNNVFVPVRNFYFPVSTSFTTKEIIVDLEEGETVFMTTCMMRNGIQLSQFYCYLKSGESVGDEIQKIENNIDDIELFRQDYEQYEEVDMNKSTYKTTNHLVNYNGSIESSDGWSYIKIPVSDYKKVRFLGLIRIGSATEGYCFKDVNDDYIDNSGHRYSVGDTGGTEDLTVDVPEGAYWFYTNYRFAANTTFTNNFYIKLVKGDTLKSIIDDAKKDCTDYTDGQIDVVQGEIDAINDAITVTEGISGLIYGFGSFTWSRGWKPVKTTDSTNKRYLRLYDSNNESSGIYIPKGTSIECPSGYTLRYSKYGVNEGITQKDRQLLEGGETMTLEENSILYIELRTSSTPLWSIPEGSGYTSAELTEAGEYGFEYLIEHIVTDLGTILDKIDDVDTRLTSEINKIKENNGSLIIEPTINRTNAVDYHANLDYLCYDLDANSGNPKHPILLRSEPTYLMIDENGADTQIENTNYPLYTYTLDMQLMYMLVDAHISQDESLGRAFPSTANSYQVYAPKTGKAYSSVAKPYKYYNDHHSIGAGNYKYNYTSGDPVENLPFDDKNNGIFYNDNWINNNKKKILIVSGIHGNEYGAPLGLYEFITRLISDPSYADLLVNCEFTFIPIANPWGYTHNKRDRGNTSINRDFDDYNGFTLQETRYIRDVLKQKKFDMVFDLHQHDLTEKNGLFGGFTSFNTANFETPMQNPDTDTLVSAAVMNGEYNGTYTFTPIGRKIANAINEVCVNTDIAACRYAELEYLQHSFLWINPRMGGTTLKKYAAGERYTIDGQPIGNANGINSGKAAYIVMTCETPITNYWMNNGSASKHNFYARCFANTYINKLLTTMCRKLVNGDFGEPNS